MYAVKDIKVLSVFRSVIPAVKQNMLLGESMISAGFPSPAEDFHESFDIVEHIVQRPAATFFMRVAGDSMNEAGIFDGDLVIVDRSLEPETGDIVVAVLNGEFTIKRLRRTNSRIELVPENPKYRTIILNEGMELEIWGVVTGSYKSFK